MNTGGLIAPADVQTIDEGAIARSVHGAQSSAPTWAVGDPVATALSGLSDMVDKYAKAYDDVVVNDYTMQKSKELDDLYNNPDTGIFNTRKGDKAQGAYQDYKATIRDIWDHDAMDKLTERQRDMASKHLYALFSDYGHRVAAFETKQLMGAQEERCKNTVQTAQDLLATGRATDNDIANGINAIRIAYEKMGEMQGWDGETVARMQDEAVGRALLKGSAALAAADPLAARGMLEECRPWLGALEYAGARAHLDGAVRRAMRRQYLALVEERGFAAGADFLGRFVEPAERDALAERGRRIERRRRRDAAFEDLRGMPWGEARAILGSEEGRAALGLDARGTGEVALMLRAARRHEARLASAQSLARREAAMARFKALREGGEGVAPDPVAAWRLANDSEDLDAATRRRLCRSASSL
ncbi:MAG: hypothetical protein J5838_02600 [Desulfovibrio sp.]|nr:hypothetical protein [Desulfovibrio sp.]